MDLSDLKRLVRDTARYFDAKSIPSEHTLRLWLEELGRLPAEAIPGIFSIFKEELESFPSQKNFPKTVRRAWHAWLAANPHKRAKKSQDEPECYVPGCDNGLLHVWSLEGVLIGFRCLMCGRSDHGIPGARWQDLARQGYVLDSINESYRRAEASRRHMESIRGFFYKPTRGSVSETIAEIKEKHGWT